MKLFFQRMLFVIVQNLQISITIAKSDLQIAVDKVNKVNKVNKVDKVDKVINLFIKTLRK